MGVSDNIIGLFRKKRKLVALFWDEVGNFERKEVKYANNTFSVRIGDVEGTYVVDMNFVTYDKKNHMPISCYYVGNPGPIRIQHKRNNEVDSIGLKKILDSKTIQDLFSEENKSKIDYILYIAIALLAICAATLYGVGTIAGWWGKQ